MLTREKWQCFNALEHYSKQKGIDLDSVPDDELEMDESAIIYVFLEANIEGVEIVKENMRYFVPLLEYNSEVVYFFKWIEARFGCDKFTWKDKEYYILIEKEDN